MQPNLQTTHTMKGCEDDPLDLVIDGGERYQREQENRGYVLKDQDANMPYNLEFNISLNGPMPGLIEEAATREQGTDITRTGSQNNDGGRYSETNARTREKRHTVIGYYADDKAPSRGDSEQKNNITFNQHINSLRRLDNEPTHENPDSDIPA